MTIFERVYRLININSQPRLKVTSRIKIIIAKLIKLLQAKLIGDLDKLNLFIILFEEQKLSFFTLYFRLTTIIYRKKFEEKQYVKSNKSKND